jgi:hypothetical protein
LPEGILSAAFSTEAGIREAPPNIATAFKNSFLFI